jgi:hypothetical protein
MFAASKFANCIKKLALIKLTMSPSSVRQSTVGYLLRLVFSYKNKSSPDVHAGRRTEQAVLILTLIKMGFLKNDLENFNCLFLKKV